MGDSDIGDGSCIVIHRDKVISYNVTLLGRCIFECKRAIDIACSRTKRQSGLNILRFAVGGVLWLSLRRDSKGCTFEITNSKVIGPIRNILRDRVGIVAHILDVIYSVGNTDRDSLGSKCVINKKNLYFTGSGCPRQGIYLPFHECFISLGEDNMSALCTGSTRSRRCIGRALGIVKSTIEISNSYEKNGNYNYEDNKKSFHKQHVYSSATIFDFCKKFSNSFQILTYFLKLS